MKITQVYYKTIRHFLPHLSQWVKDSVMDWRDPERIKYRVTNVVLSTIGLFMLKEGSRRSFNEDRADGVFAKNLAEVFDLDGVPHGDTMAYFYQGSEPEQLHQVRVACVRHLLRNKVLDPYRLLDKYVLVVFDGTGAITYQEKHCDRCLTRKLSDSQTLYYHPILEAKIVTWHGLSISLGTEFIENQPGETKQDCELKAFYRLAPKIKKDFPRLCICALMDGLMAGEPTFALCRQLNWRYLIVLQDDDLPSVWEEVESLRPLQKENYQWRYVQVGSERRRQDYHWTTEIAYQESTLNVLEYWNPLTEGGRSHWAWVTDLTINERQCVEIVQYGGRQRWKIENQGFNIQKNHGYELEHIYSHSTQVQNSFYICLQMAHLINQLVEKGSLIKAAMDERAWSLKGLAKKLLAEIKEGVLPWGDWKESFVNNFQIRLNDSS